MSLFSYIFIIIKKMKKERKSTFLFIHQNDLFAKYGIDRPSVITGGLKT